jgi:non-ribosomal peptide synthetase component F
MQATPATWRLLLETGWSGHKQLKILCGGEALPRELADQLLDRVASVWNMYGPTETTIWSAAYPLEPQDDFVLVDRRQHPLPVGPALTTVRRIPGTVHRGAGLGYLNRPDERRESSSLIPSTHSQTPACTRTGDLVKHRPMVGSNFVARSTVKIRGFRIELEIEATNQHPPSKLLLWGSSRQRLRPIW